jgi:hypothetical protein
VVVEGQRVRITLSADSLVEDLLQDRREELAAALLGEEALDA